MAVPPADSRDAQPRPTDPVDWARLFWRRQGFGDHEDAFMAMSSVLRFQRMMVEAAEGALRGHGLGLTDYMLLMTLRLSETGTRLISQLARSLLIHATTATLACDRLEAAGLVQRSPHPTDRRATLVALTAAGRKVTDGATDSLRECTFGIPGGSPETERALINVLAQLRRAAGDTDGPVRPSAG
jgi:DNA-binding MarR family transcriptional regulator